MDDLPLINMLDARRVLGMYWFSDILEGGLQSELSNCSKCEGERFRVCKEFEATLFTEQGFMEKVPMRTTQCVNCGEDFNYDGRSQGMLNFANKYLFSVEMFKGFLELKINSGVAVNAWWCSKVFFI